MSSTTTDSQSSNLDSRLSIPISDRRSPIQSVMPISQLGIMGIINQSVHSSQSLTLVPRSPALCAYVTAKALALCAYVQIKRDFVEFSRSIGDNPDANSFNQLVPWSPAPCADVTGKGLALCAYVHTKLDFRDTRWWAMSGSVVTSALRVRDHEGTSALRGRPDLARLPRSEMASEMVGW